MGQGSYEKGNRADLDRQMDEVAGKPAAQALSLNYLVHDHYRSIDVIEAFEGTNLPLNDITVLEVIERSLAKIAKGPGNGKQA